MPYILPHRQVTVTIPAGQSIRISNFQGSYVELLCGRNGAPRAPQYRIPQTGGGELIGPYPVATQVVINNGNDRIEYVIGTNPLLSLDGAAVPIMVSGIPGTGNVLTAYFPKGFGTVQWYRRNPATQTDTLLAGETNLTYTQVVADEGQQVYPRETSYIAYGSLTSVPVPAIIPSNSSLPNFTFQAETLTVANAFTVAGSTANNRRQKSLNRMVKRLKDSGAWSKITHLYLLAADSAAQALINLRNPGVNDLTVTGTPTFTQWKGYTFPTIASYLSTGVAPSTLNQDSVCMACFTQLPSGGFATSSYNMGSTDAGGSNGLSLVCTNLKVPAGANMGFIGGGSVTSDQDGMQSINRTSATNTELNHNSRMTDVFATASASPAAITAPITIGKVNGRTTTCLQQIAGGFLATGMTQTELVTAYAAIQDYVDKVGQGDMDINEAGYAPSLNTYDHIVYGTTAGSLAYAYQLARDGESVAIVGGWRDGYQNIGGMSASGLGYADYKTFSALSGIAKTISTAMNSAMGVANTSTLFVPRYFTAQLRQMFDGARAGGYSVPIFLTNGVVSATKTGTRLQTITTLDGRTFAGKYFHDGSYEGDLLAVGGVTTTIGREAASGVSTDLLNGNRGLLDKATLGWAISPRVIVDDDSSALLPEIEFNVTANGAADDRVQAYNFRLTWIQTAARKTPFPTTPPPGYATANYEIGLRGMANGISTTLLDFFKTDNLLPLGHYDLNTSGVWSTDQVSNKATAFTKAATPGAVSYAARETMWQGIANYTKGLAWMLMYDADARVASGIRTSMGQWGYDSRHYLDPHPNDALHWQPQLYIREFRRMVGPFILLGSDCTRSTGTTPRNTNTIAALAYTVDSHVNRLLVDDTVSPNRISYEGGVGVATTVVPFPYEGAVPLQSECSNLSASFCVSANHLGFGCSRMEYHMMLIGQAMAVAARLARTNGEIDLQSVSYATLRPALLAVQDAVAPNLPQLN